MIFGLSKPLVAAIAAGLLFLLAAAGVAYLAVRDIHSMVDQAAASATELADASWTAKLEKSNAEANQKITDQAIHALQIEAEATARINAASRQLEELRKRNAALPHGGDVSLTADRVRLLPD
ncbi:hypothetical protein HGP14_23445 [Rhizobium sp. P32RR-XVIII]|uniref:hypothetical protein n=1 Tax=Rhizobium sp. P32RR-XVIII TaxID=2726738 RepID=UPI0014567A8C|nr:hypothetical protein [Rhizobium sp. P32RR-XVIII]NLS06281.1 hypothetical protein [Rhizobium sp. P32RR-XVIII]